MILNLFSATQPVPWSADEFMFPVLPDDPLLMIDVEDDFEDVDGNTPEGTLQRLIHRYTFCPNH